MSHYRVTYHKEMDIEADSEQDAINQAIDIVGNDCCDGGCYSVESDDSEPCAAADDIDDLLVFLDSNGFDADYSYKDDMMTGCIGPFIVDIKFNDTVYKYNIHVDGNLPNCPERSIGQSYKGTDSLGVAKRYIKKCLDEWKKLNP